MGSGTDNPIETTVDTVSALSGGSINLLESDALFVDDTIVTVKRVGSNATVSDVTDALQSDLITTANGSIILRTTDGEITLNDGSATDNDGSISADGTGNILVEAIGDTRSITANADIETGSGNITVLADTDVTFTGTADLTSGGDGSIDVQATDGAILLSTTSNQNAGSGDIRFNAGTNVTLGGTATTTGSISVTAGGWIHDGDIDGGIDLVSSGLRLEAGGDIGTVGFEADNPIETTVTTVSALSGGKINILESNDLIVDDTIVTISRVAFDATVSDVTDATQSDLTTTDNGSIILRTTAGNITLNDGTAADDDGSVSAHGTGNVLIEAIGDGTSITANADIETGSGNITVLADTDVTFTGTADLTSGGDGSIDVQATDGAILLSTTSNQNAGSGDIRFNAGTNVTLGGTATTTGSISVTAGGWIHDGDIDGGIDLVSSGLRLEAGGDIGLLGSSTDNPIETNVDILSASITGTGDIHVTEIDDVVLRDVSTVNGSIVINTRNGRISIEDGDDGDNLGIRAGGNGDIDLEADSIIFDEGVSTTSGDIKAVAVDNIVQNAGAHITSTSGNIQIKTFGEFEENGSVDSDSGNVVKVAGQRATFIWNAVADVNLYYVTIEKDGQPYDTLWIYGETEWRPAYDLPFGDYQIKVCPTILSGYKDTIEFPVVRIEDPAVVSSSAIEIVPDAVAGEPLNSEVVVSENEVIDKNIQGEAEEATGASGSDMTVRLGAGSYGGSRYNTGGFEMAAPETDTGVWTVNDDNTAGEITGDITPAVSGSETMSVDNDIMGLTDDDAGPSDALPGHSVFADARAAVPAAIPGSVSSDTETTVGGYVDNSYLKALVRYGQSKGLPRNEIPDSGDAVNGMSSGLWNLWSDLSDTGSEHLFGKTSGKHNFSGLKGLMAPDPEDALYIMDTMLSGEAAVSLDK